MGRAQIVYFRELEESLRLKTLFGYYSDVNTFF